MENLIGVICESYSLNSLMDSINFIKESNKYIKDVFIL